MEESSSSPTVMPHVENLMVQSNKNLPVQYDTICEHVDSDSRPSPVSRRKPPPQSESSNEPAWLPDNSECCSVKGDKTPLSKETSLEAGQILASENVTKTDEKSIFQSEPSNEQACLPKKRPVQYDTICELVVSDSRPLNVSSKKIPPQMSSNEQTWLPDNSECCSVKGDKTLLPKETSFEAGQILASENVTKTDEKSICQDDSSATKNFKTVQSDPSNEQTWLPDNSECCSVKGDKTPLPKETSFEAGQILASENVTKTDEKRRIGQDESSATTNFKIIVDEDLPKKQVVNCAPHPVNNVENVRQPKDTFATVQKNHIGNGELHRHVPEVSTGKEDTSDGYNFAKEDNSVKQDQSYRYCQTSEFPTNIDHCSGENNSTDECHKRDRHCYAMPDISPGDLIVIPRFGHSYDHCMVYIGDGYVVHRTIKIGDLLRFKEVKVKKEKLADIVPGSKMHTLIIENGSWEGHDPLPTDEILHRANSKVGERGFNLYSKNCEHFARWCRYGLPVSKQANNLLSKQKVVQAVLFPWASNKFFDHCCGLPFPNIRGHAEKL